MDAIDDRAGLEEAVDGFPFIQNFTLTNAETVVDEDDGYATCTGEWQIEAGATAGNNWRRIADGTDFLCDFGYGPQGIYTYDGYIVDRAGNESTHFMFNWLVDEVAPDATDLVTGQLQYNPGETGLFNLYGSDDLEVVQVDLWLTYPTVGGPLDLLSSSTTLADRWDNTFYTDMTPQQVESGHIYGRIDATNGDGSLPGTWDDGEDMLPTAAAADIYQDAGMNSSDDFPSVEFVDYAVGGWGSTTDAPWDDAGIVTWTLDFNDVDSVFVAEHKALTSQVEPFFDSVVLAYEVDGHMMFCDETTAYTPDDNGVNRFYTYTFDVPTDGRCAAPTAEGEHKDYYAIGVSGDALLVSLVSYDYGIPFPPPPAP